MEFKNAFSNCIEDCFFLLNTKCFGTNSVWTRNNLLKRNELMHEKMQISKERIMMLQPVFVTEDDHFQREKKREKFITNINNPYKLYQHDKYLLLLDTVYNSDIKERNLSKRYKKGYLKHIKLIIHSLSLKRDNRQYINLFCLLASFMTIQRLSKKSVSFIFTIFKADLLLIFILIFAKRKVLKTG